MMGFPAKRLPAHLQAAIDAYQGSIKVCPPHTFSLMQSDKWGRETVVGVDQRFDPTRIRLVEPARDEAMRIVLTDLAIDEGWDLDLLASRLGMHRGSAYNRIRLTGRREEWYENRNARIDRQRAKALRAVAS